MAVVLRVVDDELPQRQQEGLETIVALIAVGDGHLHDRLDAPARRATSRASSRSRRAGALVQGSALALVAMAFLAVLREGFETAVFLLAAFQTPTDPTAAGIGAVLGLAAAVALG